ncbi:spore coat protein CotF [Bacillus ectoiniformans]|uniref:spore coat protein n=1 Tax=Bacillus ectoiniformans TaxID=1494429 RepID=UPI001958E218|nr:spore coat protein [Bacillus ectoiniformans]MBM7648488.1 spore coat protein CotF [Bacillus ectoiniformans]
MQIPGQNPINQQNQQNQLNQQNLQSNSIPQQMNHGGHEVLDVHEVLSATIDVMNQYTLLKQYVQEPELLQIIDQQYQFIQQEYNTTVECFKTGQKPAVPTQTYNMQQTHDFIYGMQPGEPKKPIQSADEISEEHVSNCLLGALKSLASLKAMSALEVTNPVVRRVLADSVPNDIEMAYELSLYQNKRHYYQVPQFAMQDMQQMINAYAPAQTAQAAPATNIPH